jgi:hypothetical protein
MLEWKTQLDEKALEFERLQERIAPPRDLDMLRIKIQEELSAPHAAKLAAMESEIEKFRSMFYNSRREYERVKTEFEQFSLDAAKERESIIENFNGEKQQLSRQVSKLQMMVDDNTMSNELRRINLLKTEAEAKV